MPDDDGDQSSGPEAGTPTAQPRVLYVSVRSVFLVFGAIGLALVMRNVFERSTRVLGWFAAATAVAGLVYPAVAALSRSMKRGFALLLVVILMLGTIGGLLYAAFDDIRTELDHLQEVAPEAAQRLEESERWGETARDFRLRERVESFVEQLPERLAGGDTPDVIRSATTRGASYFVAFILTLFLVLHGPRMVRGALNQIESDVRRSRLTRVLTRAYRRAWRYLIGTLAIAFAAGIYTYLWCRFADLPGASVLAIFVGLASIIPYLGTAVGGVPVVVLALGLDPDAPWAWVLLLAFIGWQLFDIVVLRARVNRRSITIGPAVTLVVGILGVDLYGLGGALVGLAFAVFVVAVVDELAPTDDQAVDFSVITG